MIRRQLLDIFSRGVRQSIEKSGIFDNNEKLFNSVDGMYRNILTDDRYYTSDSNSVEIESSILSSDREMAANRTEVLLVSSRHSIRGVLSNGICVSSISLRNSQSRLC